MMEKFPVQSLWDFGQKKNGKKIRTKAITAPAVKPKQFKKKETKNKIRIKSQTLTQKQWLFRTLVEKPTCDSPFYSIVADWSVFYPLTSGAPIMCYTKPPKNIVVPMVFMGVIIACRLLCLGNCLC